MAEYMSGSDGQTDVKQSSKIARAGEVTGTYGYLLILNQRKDREGSEKDVKNLLSFFEKILFFETDVIDQNTISETEMDDRINKARNKLNADPNISCFVCVIMAHGALGTFYVKGGPKTVESVRQAFCNESLPKFTGRPKVFLLQCCRGDKENKYTTVKDSDLKERMISVPNDADTLIAFATTPEHVAYREPYDPEEQKEQKQERQRQGSHFLNICIDVFKDQYEKKHLEEMLVRVREKVNATPFTVLENDEHILYSQMACVWSSLTKVLYLKKKLPDFFYSCR
ncbi:caspase-7-like isoform X2 [Dreissena polymorpha]|uniref:caspase-7-like isoform X2 n=1 Tax=Dreissena polymorpha TaxID=45954 RepID=UPI00226550A5|nr:caspase-7-like isoform X2 [Dreissena polymorpha]